ALHNPAMDAKAAAVRCAAFSNHRNDFALPEFLTMTLRVVSPVSLNTFRPPAWTSRFAGNWWNRIHQRQQLSDVMPVATGQQDRQRDTVGICDQMMLAAALAAIRGIRTGFCPPSTALSEALSTIARDQSICSAPCNLASSNWCNCSHTPAACQ